MQEANNLIAEEERKDPKERNEDELVKRVTPLIQQAGELLQKCNSGIRSLDPGGQLRMRAQGDEALPEERKAAKLLSEMTGETVRSVQDAKKKLENMPKAAKGINPLWKMVGMPLVQVCHRWSLFGLLIMLTCFRSLEVKLARIVHQMLQLTETSAVVLLVTGVCALLSFLTTQFSMLTCSSEGPRSRRTTAQHCRAGSAHW